MQRRAAWAEYSYMPSYLDGASRHICMRPCMHVCRPTSSLGYDVLGERRVLVRRGQHSHVLVVLRRRSAGKHMHTNILTRRYELPQAIAMVYVCMYIPQHGRPSDIDVFNAHVEILCMGSH